MTPTRQIIHLLMHRKSHIAVAIFMAMLAACAWSFRITPYTPPAMKEISSKLQTHCLGRYLIDVPIDLGSPSLYLATFYFGLTADFETVEVTMPQDGRINEESFWNIVNTRRANMAKTRNEAAGASMLMAARLIETPNGKALLLHLLENEVSDPFSVISELHAYVGGRYVILKTKSYAPEEVMRNYQPSPGVRANIYLQADPAAAEERLIHFSQWMKPAEPLSRQEAGYCINGVLFNAAKIGYSDERAIINFYSNDKIPSLLSLGVNMKGRWGYGDETLYDRINEYMAFAGPFSREESLRELRKTTRSLEGVRFQEWGGEFHQKKERSTQYLFQLQNLRPKSPEDSSFERPSMSVSLKSGDWHGEGNTSPYTLLQVESLWDQAISSLRLSPANGGTRP